MVLALLYLPYMLMLRRESFFRFNRMILLGIMALSLLLPLCNIPGMSLDRQPVMHAAQMQMIELGIPVNMLPELQVTANAPSQTAISIFMLICLIYIIGMCVVLAMRLWQVGRLWYGLKRGSLWQQKEDGITVCCHAEEIMPFSWMNCIVISEQDYNEAGREIILHETGHIRCGHSWDVLLLTLTQMVQWWNPLVYVLGISLRDVHEYEADDYVLRQGVSAQGYQLLLIKKAVGSGSYAFANNFNHSLTKKRITMMKKSKSNPWMRSKALYVIPVAALALSAFATPKFVAPIKGAVTKLEGKSMEISANLQASEEESPEKAYPLVVVNGKIFEIPEDVINSKSIDNEGQLTKLLNLKAEDIESISVLKEDAATAVWGDKGANGVIEIKTKDADDLQDKQGDDKIFDKPEVLPEFPGGEAELYGWLARNVKYPSEAIESGVQGRMIVRFVVEKDGSISDVKIVKGADDRGVIVTAYKAKDDSPEELKKENEEKGLKALQVESVRVVKAMPQWKPGTNKGKPVRCYFHLPIVFRLN